VPAGRTLPDIEEVPEQEVRSHIAGDTRDDNRERTSKTESHSGSEDHADRSEIAARGCRKRRREWVWTLEDSSEASEAGYGLL